MHLHQCLIQLCQWRSLSIEVCMDVGIVVVLFELNVFLKLVDVLFELHKRSNYLFFLVLGPDLQGTTINDKLAQIFFSLAEI